MTKTEYQSKIADLVKSKETRLSIDIDKIRNEDPDLAQEIIKNPLKLIPIFEKCLNDSVKDFQGEKAVERNNSILSNQKICLMTIYKQICMKKLLKS